MINILKQRKEKFDYLINKGYKADLENGLVIGLRGNAVGSLHNKTGYLRFNVNGIKQPITCHSFIFYFGSNSVVEQIDHKNGIKTDNRFINLRSVTNIQNQYNKVLSKGYSSNKKGTKHTARIGVNGKVIYLGVFDNETDAKNAYLDAKKIYHKI